MCGYVHVSADPKEARREQEETLKLELQVTVSQLIWALATKLRSCAGAEMLLNPHL